MRSFAVGADAALKKNISAINAKMHSGKGNGVIIENKAKPFIAAANGFAVASSAERVGGTYPWSFKALKLKTVSTEHVRLQNSNLFGGYY